MNPPNRKFIAGFSKTAMHEIKDMPGQRKIFDLNTKHPNYSMLGLRKMLKRRGIK